jgi:hypothetical protein
MIDGLPRVPVRSSRVVDLNVLKMRLSTNLEDFPAYSYFARFAAPDAAADYEVTCIDLSRDPVDPQRYEERIDRTFRAKRFRGGYYLVHYFGEPAYLMSDGRRFLVAGGHLERTVWPYFVKYLLTIHAVDHSCLHLKAAGFVTSGGGATLLAGRNSGGKTVFLAQACRNGARFLSNTHTLVRDGVAHGVPASMRLRADECFGDLIAEHQLTRHMESGDYVAAPEALFGPHGCDQAPVRNLVIVDYQPGRPRGLTQIAPEAAEAFLDQFSFAVTAYGLKDDLFAYHGNDFDAFADSMRGMRTAMRDLTHAVACYRSNVDMLDPSACTDVLSLLDKA